MMLSMFNVNTITQVFNNLYKTKGRNDFAINDSDQITKSIK